MKTVKIVYPKVAEQKHSNVTRSGTKLKCYPIRNNTLMLPNQKPHLMLPHQKQHIHVTQSGTTPQCYPIRTNTQLQHGNSLCYQLKTKENVKLMYSNSSHTIPKHLKINLSIKTKDITMFSGLKATFRCLAISQLSYSS